MVRPPYCEYNGRNYIRCLKEANKKSVGSLFKVYRKKNNLKEFHIKYMIMILGLINNIHFYEAFSNPSPK
jgi:hypothetical protein